MASSLIVGGEMLLHGRIGGDWLGDGITSNAVVQALAELGRSTDITVNINSGGGIATEGAAIYAALRNHTGDVRVRIDGIAASAASIIAMAGDSIEMSKGAVMMIHDPSGVTMGTASDHQKSIDALNAIADSMAGVYAERTGRTAKAERQSMTNETWMTAEDAIAQGYADKIVGEAVMEPAAFNYGLYARAPQHLVAMAQAKGWARTSPIDISALPPPKPRGAVAAQNGQKEKPMTDTPAAEVKAAADKQAADASVAETAAKAQADAIKAATDAATKRATDIAALCDLAGLANKTAEMLASDKSIDAIRDELLTAKAAASKGGAVDARHQASTDKPAPKWDAIVARTNGRVAS